jgi:hypothetical protein
MASKKPSFLNFQVDHMTLLVQQKMYNVAYVLFRVVFGVPSTDLLYEKRKEWVPGQGEKSMTFAVQIGNGASENPELNNTIIAVVQPTEPESQRSHVREMLMGHNAAAHWQHIALRTPDLLAFHAHAQEHAINFVTPILRDESEDLIQAFSGEWYFPNSPASGMFFEFLQRNPSASLLKKLEERNRESWFRDKTFLGLYGEKEKEYQTGKVTPFIDHALFHQLHERFQNKQVWEITDADLRWAQDTMFAYAKSAGKVAPSVTVSGNSPTA